MSSITIAIISSGLAGWVARRQRRRILMWMVLAFLIPPISLILSQLRPTHPQPKWKVVLGLFICLSIPIAVFLVIADLREKPQFCASMAAIYAYVLTCLGNLVIAKGQFLYGDGPAVAVYLPLELSLGCAIWLGLTAPALYMVSIRTRLVYILSGMAIGVVGDLFRSPLLCLHYLNGYPEHLQPWYLSLTVDYAVQATMIFAIATFIAVRFVRQQDKERGRVTPPDSQSDATTESRVAADQ